MPRAPIVVLHPSVPLASVPRRSRRWLVAAALVVAWLVPVAVAATIQVTTGADELDFVPNQYCSLREAIVSANENRDVGGCSHSGTYGTDTIHVPAGTYVLRRVGDLRSNDQDIGDLDLRSTVTIVGAGVGSTVIDGADVFAGIEVHAGASATVRDLTVRRASGVDPNGIGLVSGAVDNHGTLTLLRVTIADAEAVGVFNMGSLAADRLVIERGAEDGGIRNQGTATLVLSAVRDIQGDGPAFIDAGGGIVNYGTLTVERSTIEGNVPHGISNQGTLSVERSTIAANGDEGGITNHGGSVRVVNSTVSGNAGGGIVSEGDGALVTVLSATIADNETSTNGGGIRNAGLAAQFRIENSIVAGNRDLDSTLRAYYPDCFGSFTSWGYNLVGNGGTLSANCSGFGQSGDAIGSFTAPIDAKIAPLANNGGPTRTHALLDGSPAVDAGALGIVAACLDVDQRSVARPVDGDGNGFTHCDKGAFEAPPARADLQVALGHTPSNPLTGTAVELRAEVRNGGPYIANDATLQVALPSGFAFVSADAGCTRSGSVVTCGIGNVNAGQTVVKAVRLTAPGTSGARTATATVSTDSVDPSSANDTSQTTITVRAPSANLAAAAAGTPRVEPGGVFTLDVSVRNHGPDPATSVVLDASLTGGATFINSDGCTLAASQLTIRCQFGTLAPNEERSATLSAIAPAQEGQQRLDVVVGSSATDPLPSNDQVSWTTTVQIPRADLALTKQAPAAAQVGSAVTYLLGVENLGPDAATGVEIEDTLPGGTTFAGGSAACSHAAGTVTCAVGALGAGESRAFTIEVVAPLVPTTLTNRAEATGNQLDPVAANDAAQAQTELTALAPDAADLTLDKSGPSQVTVGAAMTYLLAVTNLGPGPAQDVVVVDTLPGGVTITGLDPACIAGGASVTCYVGSLDAGATAEVEIDVTAPTQATQIVNQAQVQASSNDPNLANDTDEVTTDVDASPATGATLTFRAEALSDTEVTEPSDAVPVMRVAVTADADAALTGVTVRAMVDASGAPGTSGNPGPGAARLHHDPDGDGALDDGVLLASGTFDPTTGRAALAFGAPFDLPAGAERHLMLSVDVAPAGATRPGSWPLSIATVMGGLSALAWRRRRPSAMIAAILAMSLLAGCGRTFQAPQVERVHYDFTLEQVDADGAQAVEGLPLVGARLTVVHRP